MLADPNSTAPPHKSVPLPWSWTTLGASSLFGTPCLPRKYPAFLMVFCPSGGASCPFGWSAFLLGGYPAFLGSPAFLVVSCPFGGAPCPFGMFSCLLGWILPSCGYFAFLVVSCPSGVASSPFGMFSSRLGWYPAFLGLSGSSGRYPAFLEGCPSLWVVSGAFWKASCLSGGYPAFVGVAFWGAFLLMKGNRV